MITSAPPLISVWVASVSRTGSAQPFTQATFTRAVGLTDCAPSAKASMLRTTSGMGTGATKPTVSVFVILPAATPARYTPS